MANTSAPLPNLAEILAPLLARLPRPRQPLLVAIAERMAAERYRTWAREPSLRDHGAELVACAVREEEIASRVEGLYRDATTAIAEIRANNPDLAEINAAIFAGRPVAQQLEIQAAGERLGAATWRSFAADATPAAREVFRACADLEEASARVLESILDEAGN